MHRTTSAGRAARTTRRPAGGRALVAVAVAIAACLAGQALPAAAAPPDPDATIELAPGVGRANRARIADDAVYFTHEFGDGTAALYSRTLAVGAAQTDVGPVTLIDRVAPGTRIAVDGETLAYTRAIDGALVLRGVDGRETVPAWGDDPGLAGGVLALTADWVVGVEEVPGELGYDVERHTLYDRQTGAAYHLKDLVPVPSGFPSLRDGEIAVSNSRAVFSLYSDTRVDGEEVGFDGIYTVALGANGPTGAVTTIATNTGGLFGDGITGYGPVGIDGNRLVWVEVWCVDFSCSERVRWRDAAPYNGTASTLQLSQANALKLDGGSLVVLGYDGATAESVRWVNLAAPVNPVRTLDIQGLARDVAGDIVVWRDYPLSSTPPAGTSGLADATGDPVVGVQTPHRGPRPFTDVPAGAGDPFADEITWLADHGIVGGYPDGTFRALASVNRDAMAAFLFRISLPGLQTTDCPSAVFTDVPGAHPFCAEISWLSENGFTTGYPDGSFHPGTPVSREAMAAFLYRMANGAGDAPACTSAPFTDVRVGDPFCGEIAWLASTGVTTGWPDGSFRPGASIERQAMAAFLFRAIDAGLLGPEAPAAA